MTDFISLDQPRLIEQLDHLSPRLRLAFANACAERLYGAYAPFEAEVRYGRPGELSSILRRLWRDCQADEVNVAGWAQQALDRLDDLIPHDDDVDWLEPGHPDLNAFSNALLHALECAVDSDVETAVAAAQHAFEVRWSRLANRGDIDLNAPDAVQVVTHQPLVQQELARQRRDLEELLRAPDTPALVRRLRERARQESVPSDTP